jgi:LysM repeat protein
MTRFAIAVAALIAVASVGSVASGQKASEATQYEQEYRAKKGDTLELVAAEYYGSRRFVILIMSVNKMDHNAKLSRGQKLRMPIPRPVTAAIGDTWKALAEQYLGTERRAKFLAAFNGRSETESLPAGTQLFIPYHMEYTAESSVKLSNLALTFLFDRNLATLLKDYNFLDRSILAKGEVIIIPIATQVSASKLPQLDAESSARRETRAQTQDVTSRALPKARKAWRAGDYAGVKGELASIESGYLDTAQAVELLLLLGSAHVAFDDKELAINDFRKALARDSTVKLSAYRYSPKIRAIWLEAGGEVDETSRD